MPNYFRPHQKRRYINSNSRGPSSMPLQLGVHMPSCRIHPLVQMRGDTGIRDADALCFSLANHCGQLSARALSPYAASTFSGIQGLDSGMPLHFFSLLTSHVNHGCRPNRLSGQRGTAAVTPSVLKTEAKPQKTSKSVRDFFFQVTCFSEILAVTKYEK